MEFTNFIDKKYIFAVVGASNNPEKYGYKILSDLLNAGYEAVPVNLNEDTILGKKAFKRLQELNAELKTSDNPRKIDVVITIVPPTVTESVVKEAHRLGIGKIWMQPGSESDLAINYCKENAISYIAGACIMIERPNSTQTKN